MIELQPGEFSRAVPLLAGIQQKVLPHAICQGHCPGRIFVDAPGKPRLALVWSGLGYYLLAGDPALPHDLDETGRVLREIFVPDSQAGGENSFILVPAQEGWSQHLPVLLPGREVIEIYRRPFRLDMEAYKALPPWQERIPPSFELVQMDSVLVEQTGLPPGWASTAAFLAHGLGVVLLSGREIASTCTSVFASDEYMEMDIHTTEAYRRRGLGALTAAAFMEICLQRGKLPNWECFWENEASTALAEKLGYQAEPDYAVYYWEE